MAAVAAWDHHPSADELLARRVAAGWTPALSATFDGEVVLGHASCLRPVPEKIAGDR